MLNYYNYKPETLHLKLISFLICIFTLDSCKTATLHCVTFISELQYTKKWHTASLVCRSGNGH